MDANQEFGLIVLEQGKAQQALAKFLNLLLNYQYGLSIMVAPDMGRRRSCSRSTEPRFAVSASSSPKRSQARSAPRH